MRRPSRRHGALFSVALIIAAGVLGSWAYSKLVASSDPPVVAPTSSTAPAAPNTIPLDVDELDRYIDDNFSDSPWHRSIIGYEQVGTDGVVVLTTLTEDEVEPAIAICRAASFWRPGDDLRVVVRAAGAAALVESPRGVGAEHCRAVRD